MEISLKNIGKIGEASVEINGITVIAGENDTGKSTVGRALFAVFNSFYHIREQIEAERVKNVEWIMLLIYSHLGNHAPVNSYAEMARNIVEHIDYFRNEEEALKNVVVKEIIRYDDGLEKQINNDNSINEFITQIMEGLNISDKDVLKFVLQKKLNKEFNGQINNIFTGCAGKINLSFNNKNIAVSVEENKVKSINEEVEFHTEIVYLDDPFVLDKVDYPFFESNYSDHREHLERKLVQKRKGDIIGEIVKSHKLKNIYDKISAVCSGDLIKDPQFGLGYRKKNSDKILAAKNLSTGFKTFAILKTLLMNNAIEYNSTVILDEPEIHLHPEWQLLFAEIIVLIQKEFGVHILLNTHSPYFLRAIQVYSAKYGVAGGCKYYLSEAIEEQVNISDVTDCVDKIYAKLSWPLQKLEDERWQDD